MLAQMHHLHEYNLLCQIHILVMNIMNDAKSKKAMYRDNQSEKTIKNIPKGCSSQITCNGTAKSKKHQSP